VAARDENKPCRYASFWTTTNGFNVHPIGYAEKMFSLGSRGRLLPVKISSASTNLDFSAYAVLGDDAVCYVTLINKTHGTGAANLSIQLATPLGHGHTDAQIIRLSTPDGDVARKTGIALGGGAITDDAQWHGRWENLPAASADGSHPPTVLLPAASAAIVKLASK